MNTGARDGGAWRAATLAALVPYVFLAQRFWWLCDDGYISFRYARHLATGHGLAFNLGESPPVEGYSNLLWVLWLALGELCGVVAPLLAPWTSAVCGALLIAAAARHVERSWGAGAWGAWSTALFLGSLAPMGLWASGGLETMPFALALFAVFAALDRDAGERAPVMALAVPIAAAAWLRNDGPLWVAAVVGAAWLAARGERERRQAIGRALIVLALAVACQALLRGLYHGDLLPNTARVKGELSLLRLERGLRYLLSNLLWLPVLPAVVGLTVWTRAAPWRGHARNALLVCLAGAGYSVLTGGDFLPMGRFLVPLLPLAALLLGGGVAQLERSGRTKLAALSLCAALLLAALPAFDLDLAPRRWRADLDYRWSRRQFFGEVESWRRARDLALDDEQLARALALHTQPGESLVRGAIGVIGYRTELTIFDRFGLVDRELARADLPEQRASPGHDHVVDPRWFLPRRPDYLEAYLVPASAPQDAAVSSEFVELLAAGRARVEAFDLPSGAEFPPGAQLRLVRYGPP